MQLPHATSQSCWLRALLHRAETDIADESQVNNMKAAGSEIWPGLAGYILQYEPFN